MPEPLFAPTSLAVLSNPTGERPKCGRCGLFKTCKSPKMPYSGSGRRKILLVAEAPGKDEDEVGRQFVGKSGQRLERALAAVGIDMRRDCWLTNSLICRPPNNIINDPAAVDYCRPNLVKTVKELNPEIIVVMGGAAVDSVIGWLWAPSPGGVTRWAGYQIPSLELNAWVCPVTHPAYVMRQEDEKDRVTPLKWAEQLAALAKLKGRPHAALPDYESQVELLFTDREAVARLKGVRRGTIAFDYETNCLKPDGEAARIHSCSVCHNGDWTAAFPWLPGAAREMKRILADPKVKKIASNAKFEDRWTRARLGVDVRGWVWDTMLAAHALENGTKTRPIASIKFQAFVKLGQRDWSRSVDPYLKSAGRDDGNAPNRIRQIGVRELLQYNGMDSLMEYEVAMLQMREMGYA